MRKLCPVVLQVLSEMGVSKLAFRNDSRKHSVFMNEKTRRPFKNYKKLIFLYIVYLRNQLFKIDLLLRILLITWQLPK